MKNIKIVVAMLVMLALVTTESVAKTVKKTVNLTELHNYFHNGNAPQPASPLITTQKEFDAQFGMATVMGKNGQPTPVNFRKQAVVAIVLPPTSKSTDIDSVSLTVTGKKELTLRYVVYEGMDMGFNIQPVRLFAIKKSFKSYKVNVVPVVRHAVTASGCKYESFFYDDTRHNVSINVDYPADKTVLAKNIRTWMGNRLQMLANNFTFAENANKTLSPVANNVDVATFVRHYASTIADSIETVNKGNANANRSSLSASLVRVWESSRFVSYEASGYIYMGGAHGMSFCDGVTFDKRTGKAVKLVKDNDKLRKLLTERLHKAIDMNGMEFFSEPVPMPQAEPYVVADGKIKFIYQPYEIAPYAVGKPACELYPYELEDYLTDEGKALMEY